MSWILVPEHQMYSLKLFIAAALALAVQASATPPVITCKRKAPLDFDSRELITTPGATVLCAGTAPYCCDGPKGPR